MNRRPLVAIAVCFALGVAIPSVWTGSGGAYALLGLSLLLAAMQVSGHAKRGIALICLLALIAGAGERWWVERDNATAIMLPAGQTEADATVTGVVSSAVEADDDLASFTLRTAAIEIAPSADPRPVAETVNVRVKLTKQDEQATTRGWQRGDRVRVAGTLAPPGDAGNFGAFDYRAYLKKQSIVWTLNAKGTETVRSLGGAVPWQDRPLRMFDRFRASVGELIDRLYPSGDAGYMKGLVAGIASDYDPQQYDDFARLGLTHILAISGLHVGVVVFLLLQLGAWARLTRERTIDLTIAAMPLYMLATGASPSAVRSCLMAMLALWLARRHRLKDGLHLLAASGMVMLLWKPRLIEDVSFQLSFLVTAGLLLFVPLVTASLPFRWPWLRGSVAVALTAQAVSFPLTAYYFHAVHALSLLANFALVPFVSFVVMPLGMASVVLGALWEPLGKAPALLATFGNELTFGIVDRMAGMIRLRTIWPQSSLLWVIAGFAWMTLVGYGLKLRIARNRERQWWDEQWKQAAELAEREGITAPLRPTAMPLTFPRRRLIALWTAIGIAGTIWIGWGVRPAWTDHAGRVMFLDVGQGDSILIRSGEGRHVLVDAGGTVNFRKAGDEWRERSDPYEVGRKLLVPLLLQRGVRELDALVLTHLDADHIGGARAVLDNVPVRSLIFNGTLKDSPDVIALFELAERRGVVFYAANAPTTWRVDGSLSLQVFYPETEDDTPAPPTLPLSGEQNEHSVVLLASLYGRTFLLPGDLESAGERQVVESLSSRIQQATVEPPRQPIDVLKAGHHGSKTSTTDEWLAYWRPAETVISVGRNNLYGHPHPTVIERLEASGTRVLRTDLDGEIQYRVRPDGTLERRTKRK